MKTLNYLALFVFIILIYVFAKTSFKHSTSNIKHVCTCTIKK